MVKYKAKKISNEIPYTEINDDDDDDPMSTQ